MRIVNVLEIIKGIPSKLESFPIYEEQLESDVVKAAESLFIKLAKENHPNSDEDPWDEELEEMILDNGSYDDKNGYEVYILWSE